MENKSYKFRYRSMGQKFAMWLKEACKCFLTPVIICCLIFFCMGITGTAKYVSTDMGGLIFDVFVIIGIVMVLVCSVLPKKVTLLDNHLEIATGSILIKGKSPKIKINYDDIINAVESTENLKNNKIKMKNSYLAGDYTNYVEITLKGGKRFCFSVEKQKEFVSELVSRMEKL